MFFEPPSTTSTIEATPFPTGKDGIVPAPLKLNRATRRQLARRTPMYKAARRQDRPFRSAFRGIITTRERLIALRAGEALR